MCNHFLHWFFTCFTHILNVAMHCDLGVNKIRTWQNISSTLSMDLFLTVWSPKLSYLYLTELMMGFCWLFCTCLVIVIWCFFYFKNFSNSKTFHWFMKVVLKFLPCHHIVFAIFHLTFIYRCYCLTPVPGPDFQSYTIKKIKFMIKRLK